MVFEEIARPTPEDVRGITQLYRDAGWWDGPDDPGHVERLVRGSHLFVVLRENGRLRAMGRLISDRASDGYIQDLCVHSSLRGRGIGARLVEYLARRAEEEGLSWIGLVAERGTEPFYARHGFSRMPDSVPMLRK